MENLITTILISFVIIVIAFIFMGIGYLLTGRSRIRGGTCGKVPTKKKDGESCSNNKESCSICGKKTQDSDEQ